MYHKQRRWCVAPAASAEELARTLTDRTWTLCTGFRLGNYLSLNDATSEDGTGECAVVKRTPDGKLWQLESITFS
jgi:hypothetical protein